MKKNVFLLLLLIFIRFVSSAQPTPEIIATDSGDIKIYPILHAAMAISYQDQMIYIDPYGGQTAFENIDSATLILITDIHGDHLNTETLNGISAQNTPIIAPEAVITKLGSAFQNLQPLSNGQKTTVAAIEIEAIPMYNLPEDSTSRHPKGRGNGYVLNIAGKRIYISGDTEDIVEMRALKNIDVAFICMNLPYTMTIESAADAALAFKPKVVYPYHYRGKGGLSDVEGFKRLISVSSDQIEVRLVNWYPNK
ncbi:MBL fold metallo-hydrolase [Reichenbachiella carrageenanivorans]|uniref:MBL fold metallo-hydrolase n=1 Tax=Reichenbachiella carrageenanivorans TaxID=2979869 RepID=A0ABY6D4S4_9BACT|nr:MBL fold metallo-hydrolase [Reichenbachiella carrageenanivorans]UXX80809.1 MBL fold metallo-hydrolase [Reichenbachiella carrageenanivorans]